MWKPMIIGYQAGGALAPDPDALESFRAEQRWREGHKLSGSQQDRIAEEGAALGLRQNEKGMWGPAAKAPADPLKALEAATTLAGASQSPGLPQMSKPSTGPLNFEDSLGTSVLSEGYGVRRDGVGSIGLGSLGGNFARGGTIDYRNGGTVAGGPPGVDTVPVVARSGGPVKAMLSNGEYALPTGTVAAIGKPALDQLVIATTGQAPVGYACGGKMKYDLGGLIDKLRGRGKQIDEAVEQAPPPPPPPEPPKEPNMADIMREIRKKNPPVEQKPQGYAQGGYLSDEEKAIQARKQVDIILARDQQRVADQAREQLSSLSNLPKQSAYMGMSGFGMAGRVPGAPTNALSGGEFGDMPESPALRTREAIGRGTAVLADAAGAAANLAKPAYGFATELVTGVPASADTTVGSLAAVPGAVALPAAAQAQPVVTEPSPDQVSLAKNGAMIRVTDPAMQKEFGKAVLTNQSEADTWKNLAGGKKGFLGEVGGAPAGVSDADYAKMSLAEKSAAKVKSMEDATAAIRSLRNARREAEGSPRVGESRRGAIDLAGLDLKDRLAIANYQRGLSNDQRLAAQNDIQNQFDLADLKIKGAGERRAQTKAQQEVQDRFIEQSAPFVQSFATDFPGMADSAVPFFSQASQLGLKDPAKAYSTLAGTYEILKGSTDTKPLFTVAGQDVTPAQAIAILNGEKPFDNWLRLKWAGKDLYDEARRVAAQKVQELALQGLAK